MVELVPNLLRQELKLLLLKTRESMEEVVGNPERLLLKQIAYTTQKAVPRSLGVTL